MRHVGFDELYEENAAAVYGYLMFKLRSEELAEDLLQETFLAVYQSLERAEKIKAPKAWILAIAQNKMVDHLRQKKPLKSLSQAEPSYRQEIDSHLFLGEILDQLAGVEQAIIYGLYVEDLTYSELAGILGIPAGTVKSKAHYARKRLRQWLKEAGK